MGLDILIITDNYEDLLSEEYLGQEEHNANIHNVSRTFCNFMCRQHIIENDEPELDQIGQITNVDITPLYDMENYPDEEGLDFHISTADNKEEAEKILQQAQLNKESLRGNIDKIIATLRSLIDSLSKIDNLPVLIAPTSFDSLNNNWYFADFNKDNSNNYIENNFGQDLRNLKRFLEFAKSKGATTAWFQYG